MNDLVASYGQNIHISRPKVKAQQLKLQGVITPNAMHYAVKEVWQSS